MTDPNLNGPIKTRRDGHVLEVTLDRPKANAIDLATSRLMGETFRAFRDDPDLRVAIVTGAGEKFFCPGWDLKAAAGGDAVAGLWTVLQHLIGEEGRAQFRAVQGKEVALGKIAALTEGSIEQ